ncbi:562_t:CDS:2 [Gigaspora rosea]|nr:562_t:CDS:2 [Gigaspora rosea]
MSLDKNTFQVNLENMDSNFSQENITNDYGDDALSVFSDNQPVTETSTENQDKTTGISTIKCHFQNRHKSYYDRIQQSTLLIQNVEPYGSRDKRKVKRLNGLLIHWIICDQQAFQVVENDDFRKLILALDPQFKVPTRQTISDHVLRIYEQERVQLCNFFQNFDRKIAMTVDTWSACTNQAYLSITLHWINDNWCMQRILLDLIPLYERHTGVFIAENIIEQIEYFGWLQSRYNNTNFCRIRCASHILNLAIKAGISVLDKSVKKAREFTSHIRRSQPCFEELKKVFMMKNKQFIVPDLDIDMRWNSTYIMLNKLCQIQEMTDILVVLLPELRPLYLTDDD